MIWGLFIGVGRSIAAATPQMSGCEQPVSVFGHSSGGFFGGDRSAQSGFPRPIRCLWLWTGGLGQAAGSGSARRWVSGLLSESQAPVPTRSTGAGLPRASGGLSEQEQLAGPDLGAGLQPVQVHPVGQLPPLLVAAVPEDPVVAGWLGLIGQLADNLPS